MATKTMRDAMGNDVPVAYVKKEDKLRDRNVRRIEARFRKMRDLMKKFVADCLADLDEIIDARGSVSVKGNVSARSFDGLIEVLVRQQYVITLDNSVCKARDMMHDYVNRILNDLGDKAYVVKKIVEAAFKTDAQGFLSRSKITELLSLNIHDPDWVAAADILRDAMRREKGKRYLQCRTRTDAQHDYVPIMLGIADCWPADESEVQG